MSSSIIHQLPSGLNSSSAEKGEFSHNNTLPPIYSSNIILTRTSPSCDCTHLQNIPLSYPVMILSPVTNEPVLIIPQLDQSFVNKIARAHFSKVHLCEPQIGWTSHFLGPILKSLLQNPARLLTETGRKYVTWMWCDIHWRHVDMVRKPRIRTKVKMLCSLMSSHLFLMYFKSALWCLLMSFVWLFKALWVALCWIVLHK